MEDFLGNLNNVVTQLCSWASNESLSETDKLAIVAALTPAVQSIVVPVVIQVSTESNGTPRALVAPNSSHNAAHMDAVAEVSKPERFCPPPHSCDVPDVTKPALGSSWAQKIVPLQSALAPTSDASLDHAQDDVPPDDTSLSGTESEGDSDVELMSVSDHGDTSYDANEENTSFEVPEKYSIGTATNTSSSTTHSATTVPTAASATPNTTPTHSSHPTSITNHTYLTANYTTPPSKRLFADTTDAATSANTHPATQHTTSSAKRQRYKTDQYNPDAPVRVADEQIYKLSDKQTKESGTTERANRMYLQDIKHYYDKGWKRVPGKGEHRDRDVFVNPKGVKYGVLTNPVLGVDFFLTAFDAWEHCKLHYEPVNPLPVLDSVVSDDGSNDVVGTVQ